MSLTILEPSFRHVVDLSRLSIDSVIVDAGACEGRYSQLLQQELGPCRIYAIEPNPTNLGKIRKLGLPNLVRVESALVGQKCRDFVEFVEFVGLPEWGNVTGLNVETKHPKLEKLVWSCVKALRINDIFYQLGTDAIDFLKMDIEGAELDVVETMSQETAEGILQISMEVHGDWYDRLTDRLTNIGFAVMRFEGELYASR